MEAAAAAAMSKQERRAMIEARIARKQIERKAKHVRFPDFSIFLLFFFFYRLHLCCNSFAVSAHSRTTSWKNLARTA